jgi:hypothetical protein
MNQPVERHGKVLRLLLLMSLSAGLVSCGDDQAPPPSDGAIQIIAETVGEDFDPNGYLWSVNSSQGQPIGHQDTVVVPALEPGNYVVSLSGMEANCTVPEEFNPQTITVEPVDTVDARFDVTCELLTGGDGGGGDPLLRGPQTR